MRSLLGLNNSSPNEDNLVESSESAAAARKFKSERLASAPGAAMMADTEASVLATFEFLNDQRDGSTTGRSAGSADNDEEVDEDEEDMSEEEGTAIDDERKEKNGNYISQCSTGRGSHFPIDSETEEVLAEFDFLSAHQPNHQKGDSDQWRPGN